jgi:hypothetical protein
MSDMGCREAKCHDSTRSFAAAELTPGVPQVMTGLRHLLSSTHAAHAQHTSSQW